MRLWRKLHTVLGCAGVLSLALTPAASAEAGGEPSPVPAPVSAPGSATAIQTKWGGHLKVQSTLINYDESSGFVHNLDARLNYEAVREELTFTAQGEILLAHTVLDQSRAVLDDTTRLLNLSTELVDNTDSQGVLRLDRLSLQYSTPSQVVRVGRQAITWGNGVVFHVLDLFNPFAPIAIDKEYKTGEDMIFSQHLFPDGSDIQGLAVGRRSPEDGALLLRESSFATKLHRVFGPFETDLVVAAHRGEPFLGGGAVYEFGGALLRVDAGVRRSAGDRYAPSTVVNLDRGFIVFEKNVQASLEYFHNGIGLQPDEYSTPSQNLLDALLRGELYTLGRDYLAPILRVELLPTLTAHALVLCNLHDQSQLLQLRTTYDVAQDVLLLVGVTAPLGTTDSEYGGRFTTKEDLGWSGYARASVYF